MKKFILLFAITSLMLFSCSPSLEKKAIERYKIFPNEALKNKFASFDISDAKVIFSDDSICVLQYDVTSENYSGEKFNVKMEYFILQTQDRKDDPSHLLEASYVLDDERGSLLDNEIIHYEKIIHKPIPSDPSERRNMLRMLAIILTSDAIHRVTE